MNWERENIFFFFASGAESGIEKNYFSLCSTRLLVTGIITTLISFPQFMGNLLCPDDWVDISRSLHFVWGSPVLFFGLTSALHIPFYQRTNTQCPFCCCCCCLYSGFSSLFAMHRQTRLSFNLHGRRGDKNEMRNFLLLVFSFSFLFRESPPCVCVCNIPPTNAAAWNRFILAVVSLGSTHVYAIHFLLLFRDFFCVRVN